jgi:hypothetical protein
MANRANTAPAVAVQGWDIEHAEPDAPPPVIVNPAASPMELIAWANGQLAQMNELLRALGRATGSEADLPRAASALRHFGTQAERVLEEACQRLAREADHG